MSLGSPNQTLQATAVKRLGWQVGCQRSAVPELIRSAEKKMPVLKCHKTQFYSQLDEEMFFDALKTISSVKKIEYHGPDLLLTVPSRLSKKTLRELLGLFFRYRVDMRQLAPFLTEKNRSWFRGPEKYWFKKVFSSR